MNRYRFVFSLFRQHLLLYASGVVAIWLTMWMSFSIPAFLEEAIDLLRENPDPGNEAFLHRVYLILGFAVAIVFVRTASRMLFLYPGRRVEFDLKNRLLRHLATLQRSFYRDNPTGSIISRINNDINGVRMMMGFAVMQLMNAVATLSLAPIYMMQISPELTLYCALPIAAAFLVLQVAFRRLRTEQLRQMKSMQDLSDFTVESYNGLDVMKAYRGYPWAEQSFASRSDAVRDSAIRLSNIRAFLMPILQHIVNGLKVMLVLVGGAMVANGEITIGQFMAYALYLAMLLQPLQGMTVMAFMLQRGYTGLLSLEAIFNTEPDLPPVLPEAEQRVPERLREGLQVQHLSYAFPDAPEAPMLKDVSLSVQPGEIVGLFGPIGSGKTTLVNALNRYLDPPAGTVLLDGIDATQISLATLRKHVVTVTQEPFLFSDTVAENILFATDAEGAEVNRAIQEAALSEDLARFPHGRETQVGEKGITLSGGQKQRISLARALLKPCDILILDDVLSAVDQETERYLIQQIYGFQHARAIFIISHRISALERADRIYVLEEGAIVDQGSHSELIGREGSYATAWQMQVEQPPPDAAGATLTQTRTP